ncbi:MAG: pimeloyl-ACP methyl ester esterase BioH [Lysobacterales bacterium]
MIRVDKFGVGPPLVLLHGWAMHGGLFAPLVRELAQQRTLHVVDLPGHGGSGWEEDDPFTLRACAAAIASRVPPAPWLGWSLGGLVALRAALDGTREITGAIALAASARFTRAEDWTDAVDDSVLASFAAGLVSDHRGTLQRFLALEALGSDHLRDELRFLQQQIADRPAPHPRVLYAGLEILRNTDLRDELSSLAIPSLWIGGRRDRLAPWRAIAASAALAPDATHFCIANAGHAPFLRCAEEVARGVGAWLGQYDL